MNNTVADDRRILWVVDISGGSGKSRLTTQLSLLDNVVCVNGSDNQVYSTVFKHNETANVKAVLFNLPKALNGMYIKICNVVYVNTF